MVGVGKKYRIVMFIITLVGSIIMIYPLLWMISRSFTPEHLIFQSSGLAIHEFTFENYIRGLQGVAGVTFFHYLVNSFRVTIPVVIGTLISSSMVGFAVARLDFPGKKAVYAVIFATMMIPIHATLIPRYIMFNELGWIGTYLPLVVPPFFGIQGFFCFLFIQFMRGIPRELDQAATVDGCSPIAIYWRIILPLSVPAFLTSAIFSFIWTYDDFFSHLIYITNPRQMTIALALRQYIEAFELSAFGVLFAVSAMSLIPVFILFISCQKYLVEGIATTGMKG